MSSIIKTLADKGTISINKWIPSNILYEVITGSVSYGITTDDSDTDVVAIAMNPKHDFFPAQTGFINGFGPPYESFKSWQQHHVEDGGKSYDLTVYGLANWFTLLAGANPNLLDVLYSPLFCVRVNTPIAQHIRSNKSLFLSQKAIHTFIGYGYAQLKKIENKDKTGKRAELIATHGFDTKYASHLVRLALQAEQLLLEGDMDLIRNAATLKAIRNGEWTEEQVKNFFYDKEKYLRGLGDKCVLPHSPDMDKIKSLLVECLEMHYGSLDKVLHIEGHNDNILRQIRELANKAQL